MSVSRREFLYFSSASLVVPRHALLAQTRAAPPPTGFETIRRNVGIFTGRGGTIGWLSNKDGLIVIDSQYPDTAKICMDGLKERAKRGVDLLFNTHHHTDHTGGNSVFKGEVKKIIAHARVPELLRQQAAQPPAPGAPPAPPVVEPTATFDKAWTERPGDEEVNAKHYGPGHTGGDAIIHFRRANVVHMGDLLFHERHPRIDRPAGASIQNWMKSVETIAKEFGAETIYVAGHAKQGLSPLVKRDALLKQRDYFGALLSEAHRGITSGKSKEEIMKLEALRGFEEYQSAPPSLTLAAALGVAYDELTQK
jgi:glyoxylase-like metal-dependent hydrolase (beta-lactamase superfamily II)